MGKRDNKGAGTQPAPGDQDPQTDLEGTGDDAGADQGDQQGGGQVNDQGQGQQSHGEAPVPLRTDGPTLAEWVEAGYSAEHYPPQGYAAREATAAPVDHEQAKRLAADEVAMAAAIEPLRNQSMSEFAHKLAAKAFADGNFAGHAALHSVELALADARHRLQLAEANLTGDALDYVRALSLVL